MRARFHTLLTLVALLSPICSALAEPEVSRSLKQIGEKRFRQYCSACHGIDGAGAGPAAAALTKAPADLTKISARRGGEFPTAEIQQYIDGRNALPAHGSREMPVWGEILSEKAGGDFIGEEIAQGQITALIEFLRSIQK